MSSMWIFWSWTTVAPLARVGDGLSTNRSFFSCTLPCVTGGRSRERAMYWNLHQQTLYFLKFHLLGWCWLIQLCRFQVYNSMINHLNIALCVYRLRSNLLPSYMKGVHIFDPLTFYYLSPTLSDGSYCCLSLWFLFVFLINLLLSIYVPHRSEII